jgi:hypothetical protein
MVKMTIDDCKSAIDLSVKLKKYKALLNNQKTRKYVDTVPLETGRGEEKMTFSIPWEYVQGIIFERINDIETVLHNAGIDYD